MKSLILLSVTLLALLAHPVLAREVEDRTARDPALTDGENHWHVSTYWAEYIEGHGLGNHALYCGDETIPACDPPDTIGGVGPSWSDDCEWRTTVTDPSEAVTVRLTGLMNYDLNDAFWDFVELYVQRGDALEMLDSWTGNPDTTAVLDYTTVIEPGEYSGPGEDEVRLVWRVWTSADGWDDEDCLNPSHGACQIDDLYVYLDGVRITFDDFEPGSPVHWNPVTGATPVEDLPGIERVAVTAHPNPFNPRTTLAFDLPRAAQVTLAVYDLQGRRIRGLVESTAYPAGRHEMVWDGRDALGQAAASGTYVYRLTAGRESLTGKLTMLK